ncbi:MAG: dinitrogenase iron-molybdenum cofactor biosynthesis protein [Rhodocyclaceae bacterium]|nr:dinitrogenase iron-molybdenum cofactor biosynthesis protein [Rhodocyclaceae bacterium]MDZ4213185.1 dinitrogenase iron-molybdenum cofactor biosynthesis protein [Rhodocyclaceae bacterium]
MTQAMTREAALRLGLAANELPGLGVPALVTAIADHCGLPLTETKLAALTVTDLRVIIAGDDHAEQDCQVGYDMDTLKRAVRFLWGEGVEGSELPPLDIYAEGDMPGSIRVACASNSAELIDGHFGSCERFLIYQVSPTETRLIAVRPTLEAEHAEDKNLARAEIIKDCQVAYFQSIGGPAAAKVVRAGVHPVKLNPKVGAGKTAREILADLQQAIKSPPPWLAKVMGVESAALAVYRELVEAEEE